MSERFLSIIIPRYDETEADVFPLLSSIANQLGVNFEEIEVIVANDGGEAPPLGDDYLGSFPFDVRQTFLPKNLGPGAARQAGLDAAVGEYVMFCDADDTLHNVGVIDALLQEAEVHAPDLMNSAWLEEILDRGSGRYVYLTHDNDNTWMHGKLLRRSFLVDNNIRFHDTFRVHEDTYFLCLAAAYSKKSIHSSAVSYVWKWNDDTITRRNNGLYGLDSIPIFIRACAAAHARIADVVPDQMPYKVCQLAFYIYFMVHTGRWLRPENRGYLEDTEGAFARHIAFEWHFFLEADRKLLTKTYAEERNKHFSDEIEDESFWAWIRRLGLEDRPLEPDDHADGVASDPNVSTVPQIAYENRHDGET